MDEKEIYEYIYSHPNQYKNYGKSNHGKGALNIFKDKIIAAATIVDVGCGYNDFICGVRSIKRSLGYRAIGVDFACPGADIFSDALSLPFADKTFNLLTSFDVLEHISPEDIERVVLEFKRVSNQFIFSISYVAAHTTVPGVNNLHLTIQNEDWWLDLIGRHCEEIETRGNYIYGVWNNNKDYRGPDREVLLARSIILHTNREYLKNPAICWLLYQSIRDKKNYFDCIELGGVVNYKYIFSIKELRWKLSIICAAIFYLVNVEDDFIKAYELCDASIQELQDNSIAVSGDTACNIIKLTFLHFVLSKKLNTSSSKTITEVIEHLKPYGSFIGHHMMASPHHWDVIYIYAVILDYLRSFISKNKVYLVNKERDDRFSPTLLCFEKICSGILIN